MATYGLPAEKILTTPIPPAPTDTAQKATDSKTLKGLGIAKPFILFVGTIDPRKNIVGLIDAYAKLPLSLRDSYSLVLAGRIEQFAQTEVARIKDAQESGLNVIHLGYVTDESKETLISSSELFASASQYEGFGMPVLEAMNHGVPCALSDIPVFREVAGEAAEYFDQTKHETIANTLEKLLRSKSYRRSLGTKGKQRAGLFKWDAVAETVYNRIMRTLDGPKNRSP